MAIVQVAVIGAGESSPELDRIAETVGRLIAEGSGVLLCGGLGGVMDAACRGAQAAGGKTVGILPHTGPGNPHLDISIRTGLGHARNIVLIQSADSVIAVGGGYGTLSEIGIALKEGKPVFGIGTWEIEGVVPCRTPEEAAAKALSAARRSR
jgi:uncharacterized protein (TIGR00725 family)